MPPTLARPPLACQRLPGASSPLGAGAARSSPPARRATAAVASSAPWVQGLGPGGGAAAPTAQSGSARPSDILGFTTGHFFCSKWGSWPLLEMVERVPETHGRLEICVHCLRGDADPWLLIRVPGVMEQIYAAAHHRTLAAGTPGTLAWIATLAYCHIAGRCSGLMSSTLQSCPASTVIVGRVSRARPRRCCATWLPVAPIPAATCPTPPAVATVLCRACIPPRSAPPIKTAPKSRQ